MRRTETHTIGQLQFQVRQRVGAAEAEIEFNLRPCHAAQSGRRRDIVPNID